MRKQSFLFIAGAVLALASCQTESTDNASDQEQIDSIVNARVEEMRVEMMMQNDSIISSLATLRADSIIAAMKGGNTVTTNTTRTTTVRNTPTGAKATTTTKPSTNPKEGRFSGEGTNNTTQKEGRFSEEGAKKAQEQNTKKKEERFK